MGEAEYRQELERIRIGINRSPQTDAETVAAYFDWMNSEIADMEREMKNTRVGARVPLRVRLKNLVVLILTQNQPTVKNGNFMNINVGRDGIGSGSEV